MAFERRLSRASDAEGCLAVYAPYGLSLSLIHILAHEEGDGGAVDGKNLSNAHVAGNHTEKPPIKKC